MAIPLITITGPLLAPNGVAPAKGTIHVLASAPFSVMDGATPVLVAMGKLIRLVEGTGALPDTFQLSPTPAGYWYEFRFDIDDVDGVPHKWSQRYQIEASPATLPIASLTVYLPPPAGTATPLRLATAASPGMVQLAGDLGGPAAAPTVTATHLAVPLPQAQGGSGAASLADAGLTAYDLLFSSPGTPTADQVLARVVLPRAATLPANLTGSVGKVGTNPTATATISIQKNGVEFGTASISTGGVVTFAAAAPTALAIGDVLSLVAQASPDANLADVSISLVGTAP